jgi:hypothetical protein
MFYRPARIRADRRPRLYSIVPDIGTGTML